LAYYLIYWIR